MHTIQHNLTIYVHNTAQSNDLCRPQYNILCTPHTSMQHSMYTSQLNATIYVHFTDQYNDLATPYCSIQQSMYMCISIQQSMYTFWWIRSSLVQVMAFCRDTPNDSPNQCSLIVTWALQDKLQWNLNIGTDNVFEISSGKWWSFYSGLNILTHWPMAT